MSDTHERPRDDAPVTASKTIDPERALSAEAVTIARPAGELYQFWRNPLNLARIMENVVEIVPLGDDRSRWTIKGPGGKQLSWESVITAEEPGRSITWQSTEGADVANSGKIEFIEAGERGTVVRAIIAYDPPGGSVGQVVAKLFQREPRIQTRRDLRRFKQLMETGEIATGARTQKQREERLEAQP
ncbi:MAG: hypothetical protein RL268_2427 [Pseudomonadota bacterium]